MVMKCETNHMYLKQEIIKKKKHFTVMDTGSDTI